MCSKTCDGGVQIFVRNKTMEERFGGTCSGIGWKHKKCNEEPCPSAAGKLSISNVHLRKSRKKSGYFFGYFFRLFSRFFFLDIFVQK